MSGPDVPRVAVVGSGPAGLYTVAALQSSGPPVEIDVLDRLPTPYGLVRYGVAPDHAKIKAVARVLAKPFAKGVRFLGNVEVGRDVTHDELLEHYHAVVYASGTENDARVGIPGEDLDGCLGSSHFVRWYNGHPDAEEHALVLDARAVAVIGAGNVALDVARVLCRTGAEMRDTDVPHRVLDALDRSRVTDVHVLIRRTPADARFTPAELFQLGELADADVILHDGGAGVDDPATSEDRRVRLNLEAFRTFAATPPAGRSRRIHLRFLVSPRQIVGDGRVEGIVVEHNERSADGGISGTGRTEQIPVGAVITAVGFRGVPPAELPHDERGVVTSVQGRVVRDGAAVPGVYVAGWLKRGPSGVIGTNKPDGAETAAAVVKDLATLSTRQVRGDLIELLNERGAQIVDWAGWLRLDDHEAGLGGPVGRGRVKVHDLASMLQHSVVTRSRIGA
ncbi:FAD-dependent oxidoreductase [Pseudonocardia sp. CA-107938]|uniref:FAD-dependent oxidoreductase n=1 Tax=Pseudonocardia sp. CA-107938 TaxID=3240021 RepID=UPI003D907A06